jgi:ClpP class serine protease
MLNSPINLSNENVLTNAFNKLETLLKTDVLVFSGSFVDGIESKFKDVIEKINSPKQKKLSVILTTNGGSLAPVIRIVTIFRHFYDEVDFYIPNYAYSAGTIICCSGDRIFMDYNSVLGPIDPQVYTKDGKLVSALGYLDKINELIRKAKKDEITKPEFMILKDFDLAEWRNYEQVKNLATDLLAEWLPKYKFKDWVNHSSTKKKVTIQEKKKRAKAIAKALGDNGKWKSHSRPINRNELEQLKLKINKIEDDPELYKALTEYDNLMVDFMQKYGNNALMQARGILL